MSECSHETFVRLAARRRPPRLRDRGSLHELEDHHRPAGPDAHSFGTDTDADRPGHDGDSPAGRADGYSGRAPDLDTASPLPDSRRRHPPSDHPANQRNAHAGRNAANAGDCLGIGSRAVKSFDARPLGITTIIGTAFFWA